MSPTVSRPSTGRHLSVSSELRDATCSLLHLALAPHHPPHRRKSVQDLRVPPAFPPPHAQSPQRHRTAPALGQHPERRALNPSGSVNESLLHPFPDSGALLRRCTSEIDLDLGPDNDDESDFESDDEPFRLRPSSIRSVASSCRSSSRFGVRLEDRSDRETACFATDACIRSFYPVGEKAGGHVVFVCEVSSREGTLVRTLKRYSAFVRLRSELVRTFPGLLIPRLPPKSSLSKFRQSFLERRRQQLSFWLTTVLLHPETGGCAAVRSWILEA